MKMSLRTCAYHLCKDQKLDLDLSGGVLPLRRPATYQSTVQMVEEAGLEHHPQVNP